MKFTSNISQVIRRLQLLQEGMPEMVRALIAPKHWSPLLRVVARRTLIAEVQATRNEQSWMLYLRIVDRMVPESGPGFFTAIYESSMVARYALAFPPDVVKAGRAATSQFHKPEEGGPSSGYAAEARAYNQGDVLIASDRMRDWHEQNLQAVRDTIDKWVMLEKRIDDRDAGLTEQQISERVQWIMGVAPGQRPQDQTDLMRELGEKISAAIQKWLDGEGDTPPVKGAGGGGMNARPKGEVALTPEVAALWVAKVMLAWRTYVQTILPHYFEFQMAMLHRRVREGLI